MKLFSTPKLTPLLACALIGNAFAGTADKCPHTCPPAPAGCQAGWNFGAEALIFRPFESEGAYNDSSFDVGGRFSLSYTFDDCLFVKTTYMNYNTDGNQSYNSPGEIFDLDLTTWDLVVGDTFHPSEKLTFSPSFGLRYAKFDENIDGSISEFSGLGVVVGIDLNRQLSGPWSLYFNAKHSLVFGQTDEGTSTGNDNSLANITEIGGGVQYDFSWGGVNGNLRAGVEGQWWSGVSDDDTQDAGAAGFVLGANVRF